MAQYKIPDPDEEIICPYDKSHVVAAKRMQYHLMKCRKNHPGKELAVCPYNARHEVRKIELRYHMSNCPDKARLEPMIIHEQNKQNGGNVYSKGCTDLPSYEHSSTHSSQENWDEEIPRVARVGVDPNYFARLDRMDTAGMSKAAKKEYKSQLWRAPEDRCVNKVEEGEVEGKKTRMPNIPVASILPGQGRGALQHPGSSVMALSLAMAGVGRGRATSVSADQSMPGMAGRGRAIGRGMTLAGRGKDFAANGYADQINPITMENGETRNQLDWNQSNKQTGSYVSSSEMFKSAGRGRSAMLAQRSPLKEASPHFVPNLKEKAGYNSSIDEDGSSSSSGLELEKLNPAKEMRKIVKKLRQIETLEQKLEEGQTLSVEEEIKMDKKDELVKALELLRLENPCMDENEA